MEETKQFQDGASRAGRDSDGLDSVSKVSVTTPHSHISRRSDEVSYVSAVTKTTSMSTKNKLEEVQAQLDAERKKRLEAEAKMAPGYVLEFRTRALLIVYG